MCLCNRACHVLCHGVLCTVHHKAFGSDTRHTSVGFCQGVRLAMQFIAECPWSSASFTTNTDLIRVSEMHSECPFAHLSKCFSTVMAAARSATGPPSSMMRGASKLRNSGGSTHEPIITQQSETAQTSSGEEMACVCREQQGRAEKTGFGQLSAHSKLLQLMPCKTVTRPESESARLYSCSTRVHETSHESMPNPVTYTLSRWQ